MSDELGKEIKSDELGKDVSDQFPDFSVTYHLTPNI